MQDRKITEEQLAQIAGTGHAGEGCYYFNETFFCPKCDSYSFIAEWRINDGESEEHFVTAACKDCDYTVYTREEFDIINPRKR